MSIHVTDAWTLEQSIALNFASRTSPGRLRTGPNRRASLGRLLAGRQGVLFLSLSRGLLCPLLPPVRGADVISYLELPWRCAHRSVDFVSFLLACHGSRGGGAGDPGECNPSRMAFRGEGECVSVPLVPTTARPLLSVTLEGIRLSLPVTFNGEFPIVLDHMPSL